jgi:hypothetical protein
MNCRHTSSMAFAIKLIFSMSGFVFKFGYYTSFIFRKFDRREYITNNKPIYNQSLKLVCLASEKYKLTLIDKGLRYA